MKKIILLAIVWCNIYTSFAQNEKIQEVTFLTYYNFYKIYNYIQKTGEGKNAGYYINNEILNYNILAQKNKTNSKEYLYIQDKGQKDLHFRISVFVERSNQKKYECIIEQVKENEKGEQIFVQLAPTDVLPHEGKTGYAGIPVYHLVNIWLKQILSEIELQIIKNTPVPQFKNTDIQKSANGYVDLMKVLLSARLGNTTFDDYLKKAEIWKVTFNKVLKLNQSSKEVKRLFKFFNTINVKPGSSNEVD